MAPNAPGVQYQHYIPRFILRKFLEVQGPPKTSKQRSKENWKARKKGIETELASVYDLSTKTLQSRSIAKSFGEINLYTDIAAGIQHSQHVEEKLSQLENEAAQVIMMIQDSCGKGTLTLTRNLLEVLRKFVFIMHYRKPNVQANYFDVEKDGTCADWIQRYMETHELKTKEEAWLRGLAYFLDTPHASIVTEGEGIIAKCGQERLRQMLMTKIDPDIGNWFAVDYESLARSHYFGIWEAAPGSEFIVGNNSFGLWEGLVFGSPDVHRIFVISPKLVLVLRNNVLRRVSKEAISSMVNSDLADVPTPSPDTQYHNGPFFDSEDALRAYRATKAAQQDKFIYRITKLTEEQTRSVNNVILLNVPRDGSLVFSSKRNMLHSIRHYFTSAPDPFIHLVEKSFERYSPLLGALEQTLGPALSESDSDFRLRVVLQVLRLRLDRFRSEWDACYWCYKAITADPSQTHPLAIETRCRLAQAKKFITDIAKNVNPQRNPTARLSDTLSKADSNRVLGRVSTMLAKVMEYNRTKPRTDEGFVRESVIVGLIEWMVRERPKMIEKLVESDVYRRLVGT